MTNSFASALLLLSAISARADAGVSLGTTKRPALDVRTARPMELVGPSATVLAASLVAGAYGRITSIFRSAEHNRHVGGVPNSYHLHGQAIDITRRPGVTHHQIAEALRLAGYNLIESLDEGDHSHFAFASGKNARDLRTLPALNNVPPVAIKRLLADEHGTLQADLSPTLGASGQGAL